MKEVTGVDDPAAKVVSMWKQASLLKAQWLVKNFKQDLAWGICKIQGLHGWLSSRFHSESTLRFIPEGCKVPRVLIHLLSRILMRHGSRLYSWSITTTAMSVCECPSPVKWFATGDSSILLCAMLKRWPSTLRCSGCPVTHVLLATPPAGY